MKEYLLHIIERGRTGLDRIHQNRGLPCFKISAIVFENSGYDGSWKETSLSLNKNSVVNKEVTNKATLVCTDS